MVTRLLAPTASDFIYHSVIKKLSKTKFLMEILLSMAFFSIGLFKLYLANLNKFKCLSFI